ncbi:hypothetical protein IVB45_11375 [Bradyrhizobium sp. 4]|uniref:hypothetical protein n=1 Tax=unclassified Bradyrhizobium TaxID=2631580 RepID=UPI001FFBA7C3|nr:MULTISPECIES: hypothetical protein [unclassified Bradyrhizobium]MCK1400980.1 hypothetical protein [Bradyrhizobium sp. 39]MCK1753213.1 hypothetical protein [Bradyrhizobium sp. 135]UPJ37389.1 hypothetical protein IVB45_11375 [Bradyrhizobium sp. 4]
MPADGQFDEQEVLILRYRALEREVTDPLAAVLLHDIVQDLEADLHRERAMALSAIPSSKS